MSFNIGNSRIPVLNVTKTEEERVEYLEEIYDRINEGYFDECDPEFVYCLSLTEHPQTTGILNGTIDPSKSEYNLSIPIEKARYAAFVELSSNQMIDKQVNNHSKYNKYKEEFQDKDLYPYFESWYHLQTRFDDDLSNKIIKAISEARKAVKNCPENFFLQYQLSEAVLTGVDELEDFQAAQSRIGVSEEELIRQAIKEIQNAIDNYPERGNLPNGYPFISLSACYASLAQLNAINNDIDAAKSALTSARENYHDDIEDIDKNDLSRTSIKVDTFTLENNIRDRADELESNIDDVQVELENTSDRFRSDIIQYIGFFAGVITIAVVSAQISTVATSFGEAARLILVFSGGLLLSFGGFSLMLPYNLNRQHFRKRLAGLLLIGILIIVLGMITPEAVAEIVGGFLNLWPLQAENI
jgi:tetratricopeptide (TPR) repeat protein